MQENITLRTIQPQDNSSIAAMIREVFAEHDAPRTGTVFSDPTTDHLYELFQIPSAVMWVAEAEQMIVGCCGIYPTEGLPEDCAELAKFYLPQQARGKGIGRALMEQCMQSARELGYKKIYLESLPAFSKAVSIYEKQGFEKLAHPLGNSGHSSCNIWMVKELV